MEHFVIIVHLCQLLKTIVTVSFILDDATALYPPLCPDIPYNSQVLQIINKKNV